MKTSKKLIALVLFVAMMLMMVPAANAANATYQWTFVESNYVLGIDSTPSYWFTGASARSNLNNITVTSSFLTPFNVENGKITAAQTADPDLANPGTGINVYATNGLAGSSSSAATVTLKGSYADDFGTYYYTQYGAGVAKAKAMKVPYRVHRIDTYKLQIWDATLTTPGYRDAVAADINDPATLALTQYVYTDVTAQALINGAPTGQDYLPNAGTSGPAVVYYMTLVLEAGGNSQDFKVTIAGESTTVTLKFTDSGTSADTELDLKVVSKSGNQSANYAVVSQKAKDSDYHNILYFDIAKRNEDDADTIGSIVYPSLSTFFQAYNANTDAAVGNFYLITAASASNLYPVLNSTTATNTSVGALRAVDSYKTTGVGANTWEQANADAWNAYYKAVDAAHNPSSNYNRMRVKLQAIDANGAVMPYATTINAVVRQASSNAIRNIVPDLALSNSINTLLDGSDRYAVVNGANSFFLDADGCFQLNIYGIRSWNAITSTNISLYAEKMYEIDFEFKSAGTVIGSYTYDIVFRNVERSSSSITVLQDTYTLEVGETATIQFVINDDAALEKTVAWKSVNKSIVKVTTASTGKIEAVALGTALVYTEDAAGNAHVVTVNVVDPAAEPDPTDEPGEEPSDEDGAEYVVTASSLNVRKGPGTSYGKVGSLKRGASVTVIGESGSWMQIEAQSSFKAADKYYVSGKYLALAD